MTRVPDEQTANRVALVTGGGRGIGRAVALALARSGHDVAVAARTGAEIAEVAAEVERLGRRALAVVADVSVSDDVTRLHARVREGLGPVHVLCNNAGVEASVRFTDTTDALWARVLGVNLTGTFLCTRACLPDMLARRAGRIINIASTAARTGHRFTSAYAAAKHGVLGLTRALAVEVATQGITVNAVCPGWTDTAMLERAAANIADKTGRTPDQAREALAALNPQGRLVRPDEVAALVAYLASDVAQPITGQALGIDGGEVRA